MTALEILIDLSERGCTCRNMQAHLLKADQTESEICDPCRAKKVLEDLARIYREASLLFHNNRARVACEIAADVIESRDVDSLEIADVEEDVE